jgi:hypothetical protein
MSCSAINIITGNNIFGCQNTIDQLSVISSVAEGYDNSIMTGLANHVEGLNNIITGTTGVTGFNGSSNNHVEGQGNIINSIGNKGVDSTTGNIVESQNCHVEGLTSVVGGYQNHVEGCDHRVNGFESHVVGCGNFTDGSRAGQNQSGFGGYFLYDKSKTFGADIYNYSNQLGGGLDGPGTSQYPGEGISMIDKTLLNGIYPISQHQAYRNTSDGLSYSIMLKGPAGLKTGTFVTFDECMDEERLIKPANTCDDIIGVITKSSGFIANAGQFPASTRIKYDAYQEPIVYVNYATSTNVSSSITSTFNHHFSIREDDQLPQKRILFPGFQTVLEENVDRAEPFVPFTEREEYYQVALSGLVVVNVYHKRKVDYKCDVKCGQAIKGETYWVVKIIDNDHILILLK